MGRRCLQGRLDGAAVRAAPFVVWVAGRAPAFAGGPPFDLLASIGLRDSADRPKEAWTVWAETASRPYVPPSGEPLGQ